MKALAITRALCYAGRRAICKCVQVIIFVAGDKLVAVNPAQHNAPNRWASLYLNPVKSLKQLCR